jgi:hypothetical protein
MNIVKPPVSSRFRQPPEEIDGLLRAWLRSEMPDPWPAPPALPEPPARLALPRTARWFHLGSRFALAATLAACLVGSLVLASLFPSLAPPANKPTLDDTNIGRAIIIKTTSPDGHPVKVEEKKAGNTVLIRVELDDMP